MGSLCCPVEDMLSSCPLVGGWHTSFTRLQAEQGQVLVVAASHLIFLFRQPLQALITE